MTVKVDSQRNVMVYLNRIAVLAFSLGIAAVASAQDVELYQTGFELNGVITPNTEHGLAKLDYQGTSSLQYLNLTVGSQWVLQDVPIFSQNGFGVSHSLYLPFDFGTGRGNVVLQASFGFTLTAAPTGITPVVGAPEDVLPFMYRIDSGETGAAIGPVAAAGGAIAGGLAAAANTAKHKDFPNQQSGPGLCVPTAISNSLKWLKSTYGSNLTDAQNSPAALATALGSDASGTVMTGADGAVELKKKYLTSLNSNIVTSTSTDWKEILKAMKDGKDVELSAFGHMVALTGISDLGSGKYQLDINHDTDQKDNAKGTITERVVFDTGTGKFENGTWIKGKGLRYAMIESVPEPSTMVVLGIGALAAMRRRRKA